MFSPTTLSDIYLQLSFLFFRSLILFMNGAEPVLPVHNTIQSDDKNTFLSRLALDYASSIPRESTCNWPDIAQEPHSKAELTPTNTASEGILGSIRPISPIPQRKIPVRTCTSFEENATSSNPHGGLETSVSDLGQAHTSCSVDSLVHPDNSSLQWPSIPHEAVRIPVIMPVKKPVQHNNVSSLTGTDLLHRKPLPGCNIKIDQDFYHRHLPTKPAPIIPRRINCVQPGFILPLSFNTITNAPLLLPTATDSESIYLQGAPSSSAVNALYDGHHPLLPAPVTIHTRQPWIPSLGHWVNTRLSAVLTCTPLGMVSNSDSMEEFLARFSNPEGLHKPWHQILDDLEYDLDPFRAV